MPTTTNVGDDRPARRSYDETRELLLGAGERVLAGELTVSLDHVKFEEIVREAGVSRSSAYLLWPTRDHFLADVAIRLVEPDRSQGAAFDEETLAIARATVRKHAKLLESSDGRRKVMLEAIRLGARRNFEFIAESPRWRTYTALCATLQGFQSPHRERVWEALQQAESHFLDRMSDFYDEMLPVLGYRVRAGCTSRQIAALGTAIVEGMAERRAVMADLVDAPVSGPGIEYESESWHLAAVGFLGVIDVMVEPIRDSSN